MGLVSKGTDATGSEGGGQKKERERLGVGPCPVRGAQVWALLLLHSLVLPGTAGVAGTKRGEWKKDRQKR